MVTIVRVPINLFKYSIEVKWQGFSSGQILPMQLKHLISDDLPD